MRSLRLSQQQIQAIIDHVVEQAPKEACGLIAGNGVKAHDIIPFANVADNPSHHFEMDALALLDAHKKIESANMDLIGIYHSHMTSEAIPSQEDVRAATINTPNQVHLIVSLKHRNPRLQAWHIHNNQVDEVELLIGQQQSQVVAKMTSTEVWAVILAIIISVVILLAVSFSLLPPAPAIPTPQ